MSRAVNLLEKIFYYSYRKEAIAMASAALYTVFGGSLFLYFGKAIFQSPLAAFKYIVYSFSLFFIAVSFWYVVRPNKKYIRVTNSDVEILTEKNKIVIPRSQINSVELSPSPIKHMVRTLFFGNYYIGESGTLLKLSLKDTSQNAMVKHYEMLDKKLFDPKFIYISDDKKDIYLRLPPVGGFNQLLEILNS
jgi:hypothetical protein